MRLSLCEAPTRETRPDHNTGNYVSYSFRYHVTLLKTEPTVYSPYPRRPESLSISDEITKAAHSPQLTRRWLLVKV